MLQEELADDYLETVEQHLQELEFKRGVLESAELGKGNKGTALHASASRASSAGRERLPFGTARGYSFTIPPRDESGFRALAEIRGQGLNQVANALAQSADHVKSFFSMLRLELAFYLGCLNLQRAARRAKASRRASPNRCRRTSSRSPRAGLYDVCLTLTSRQPVVGNDIDADDKSLVMITGANQGGKSTLLRSLGLAQLMMQSGMFVGARVVPRQRLRRRVHALQARRGRDAWRAASSTRSSPDERDRRPDHARLASCSATSRSRRPTSAKARRSRARSFARMLDKQIKVVFVTHMYDLAHGFHAQQLDTRAVPARRARSPTAAHVQARRGRAAADQLRRGLLPAHLRHPRGGTGAPRGQETVTQ